MAKYYAVKEGRVPGIYNTWDECKKQVKGYSKAVYKKFNTLEEAEGFIGFDVPKPSVDVQAQELLKEVDEDTLIAYVDGSFLKGTPSYGLVLLYKNTEERLNGIVLDTSIYSMRNVAGEIEGAKQAIKIALERNFKKVKIYHDYIGIARWCVGEVGKKRWKANLKGTQAYQNFYDLSKNKIEISFVKVKAHSGDKYNEIADQLAKEALC